MLRTTSAIKSRAARSLPGKKKSAQIYLCIALISLAGGVVAEEVVAESARPAADAHTCPRKFTDEQIDQILIEKLPLNYRHRVTVNYANCIYGVVIWPEGGPVDSQTPIELDKDGNLPSVVLKYGIHRNIIKEGPAYLRIDTLPYPARALEENVSGTVLVRVSIAPDSSVSSATVIRTSPRGAVQLTEGLADAIHHWRFEPLTLYGNPLPTDVIVPVHFTIKGKAPASSDEQPFVKPDDTYVLEPIEVEANPIR